MLGQNSFSNSRYDRHADCQASKDMVCSCAAETFGWEMFPLENVTLAADGCIVNSCVRKTKGIWHCHFFAACWIFMGISPMFAIAMFSVNDFLTACPVSSVGNEVNLMSRNSQKKVTIGVREI
jgi:hypothetical protein